MYKNNSTYGHTGFGSQGFGAFQSQLESTGIGGAQPQLGTQQGNYVNPHYLGREEQIVQQTNPQSWYHPGNQIGQSIAQSQGQQSGWPTGYTAGNQMGFAGQQSGMQSGFAGQQSGMQTGFQPGMQTGQQAARFGATELMMVHEALTDTINGINQFELYRQHVKDQQLMQILDSQINHKFNCYNRMVNQLHNQGVGSIVPYRTAKSTGVKYGLRQPAAVQPNTGINEMDDRDVASAMLGCNKAAACLKFRGALECTDPNLRNMMVDCAVSAANLAYEVFLYMNQKGMYQVPTMAQQTTQTMMGVYQNVNQPSFR